MTARIVATLALVVFWTAAYMFPNIQAAGILTVATLLLGALVHYGMEAADLYGREMQQNQRRATRAAE